MKSMALLCVLLFTAQICNSQKFSSLDTELLYSLDLNVDSLDISNVEIRDDLFLIAKRHYQRNTNNFFGYFFGAASVGSLYLAGKIANENVSSGDKSYQKHIAILTLTSGLISAGISYQFFARAKRKKKKRDYIISKYK